MNFFTHCFLKLKITKQSITYSYSNIIACYITFVLENGFLTMSLLYCNRSRVMKIARYIAINVANSYDMQLSVNTKLPDNQILNKQFEQSAVNTVVQYLTQEHNTLSNFIRPYGYREKLILLIRVYLNAVQSHLISRLSKQTEEEENVGE